MTMTNLTQLHQNDLGHGGTSCHMLGSSDDTTELTRVTVQRQRKEYFQATQLSCGLVKKKKKNPTPWFIFHSQLHMNGTHFK